ncbi:MAG: HAD-IC family P-type ATPase [Bacillota bacterium]|nr:HAD-IC family P-type ATPase [Bacillota bacterium]
MLYEISVIPGRVRFRSNRIYRNKPLAKYINSYIEDLYGVCYSSINYSTGSILVVYDEDKTNHELLAKNIKAAITSEDNEKVKMLKQNERYYKTIEKRDNAKRKSFCFGMLYLLLKLKHSTIGKFSLSRNVAVLEAASAVTIIGGYPMLKTLYKKFSRNVPADADILLKLTAASFTILRESSKGTFVLFLKSINDYIKLSAEVECMRMLNSGMSKTSGMVWLALDNNQEVLVPLSSLKVGDVVNIHRGEISPIQGKIEKGTAIINCFYQTGQPMVKRVGRGSKIQDGSTVVFGDLRVRVQNIPVLTEKKDLSLEHLNIHKKLETYQNSITKFALGAASLNYIFTGNMLNALTVLLVFTPSAAGTALSNGMKNYVAALKKYNIYLKNPNTFEKIASTDSVIFDKTGTLTYGNMRIMSVESFSEEYSSDELLKICAACEADKYHPISTTLQNFTGENYDVSKVKWSVLIPSQGIEAVYDKHKLLIGNIKLFKQKNIDISKGIDKYKSYEKQFNTPILIAMDNELVGIISMKDEMRNKANLLVEKLKYSGIDHISLVTGDTYEKACDTAEKIGIERIYAECSYEDKVSIVAEEGKHHTTMMVGDGINDIDAMKAADASISFVNSACDKIKLQSDCIILDEDMDRLADLIYMSHKSYKLMKQSIGLSELYNLIFGSLAFFGHFDAFNGKSLNTINTLMVLLLNERIRWILPDRNFKYELDKK